MVESRGVEPLSKLRSILKITYTIANLGGWRALGDNPDHHLLLLAVKQEIGSSQGFYEPQVFTSWQDTVLARRLNQAACNSQSK